MNITVYAASSGQVPDKYIDMSRQLGENWRRLAIPLSMVQAAPD